MSSVDDIFPKSPKVYSPEEARELWLELRRNEDDRLTQQAYAQVFSNKATGYKILSADEASELPIDPKSPWGILYSDSFWTFWRDPVRIGEGDPFMYLRMIGPNLESSTAGVVVISELDGKIKLNRSGRHATRNTSWELPRGFADKVISGALKELQQECGQRVDPSQVIQLGNIHLDSGLVGQPAAVMHVVVRTEQIGASSPESTESIESGQFFSRKEIRNMINTGQITDGPTIAALGILASTYTKPEGSAFYDTRKPVIHIDTAQAMQQLGELAGGVAERAKTIGNRLLR